MIRTVPAMIDVDGRVQFLEPVSISGPRRAYVMILDDESSSSPGETALLSEAALAVDWNRPEEDAAWSELKAAK